jgi:hypothetical protein
MRISILLIQITALFACQLIGVFEWGVLQYTQGTFVYPVDDTFIHLAIAKNLVYHHIWGVTTVGVAGKAGGNRRKCTADSLEHPVLWVSSDGPTI